MRKALATLPWVEQASVQTDVNAREVRFNLVDKAAFDEFVVQRALQAQNFHEMTVRAAPARMNGV